MAIIDKTPEERIARFVTDSFELRKCRRHVRVDQETLNSNKLLKENDCNCGRDLKWHLEEKVFNVDKPEKWSYQFDTTTYPCNDFGIIEFYPSDKVDPTSLVPGTRAKYIRLAGHLHDEYLKQVYQLLTDRLLFNFPKPQLLIEVTGFAKELVHVDKPAIEKFNSSLIQAAKSTKAWLVTGGSHSGVMRLVGDAVTKYRLTHRQDQSIPCIGIASWGIINDRSALVSQNNDDNNSSDIPGKWPAKYYVEKGGETVYPSLDPGHNCFLLVDNAIEKRFGEEIMFRSKLMEHISKQPLFADDKELTSNTPRVILVVGGGPNTLKTVKTCCGMTTASDSVLEPVILFPGFGGLADVLAFAYKISAPPEDRDTRIYSPTTQSVPQSYQQKSLFPSDFNDRVQKHPEFQCIVSVKEKKVQSRTAKEKKCVKEDDNTAKSEIGQKTVEDYNCQARQEVVEDIRRILHDKRHLITLVDLFDPESDEQSLIDRRIMDAIVKVNVGLPKMNFTIAELWNRSDVAMKILRVSHKDVYNVSSFEKGLLRSIKLNQHEFFEVYMKYGSFDLNKVLTLDHVRSLYVDILLLLKVKSAITYGKLFRTLIVNNNRDFLVVEGNTKRSEIDRQIGEVMANLLGCYMDNTFAGEAEMERRRYIEGRTETAVEYVAGVRDVFLLMLLLNRTEMAVKLWTIGSDHIGSALMASNFLKSLSKEAIDLEMMDIGAFYEEASKEWQVRATKVLAACYDQDQETCTQLLSRSLQSWQGLTLLEMAYYGKKMVFMEQPAVQTRLSYIWFGKLASFTRPLLIYIALIPVCLPFAIFHLRFLQSSILEKDNDYQNISVENRSNKIQPEATVAISMESEMDSVSGCCKTRLADSKEKKPTHGSLVQSKTPKDVILLRPALHSDKNKKTINVFTAIYHLYSSPIAKFTIHSLVLAVYLLFYSYFVFVGPKDKITTVEAIVWIWTTILLLDKIRMITNESSLSGAEKVESFISDFWFMSEVTAYVLLVVSVILRLALSQESYVYPRTTYALSCLVCWIRSLRYFYMSEFFGPRITTLSQLVSDLFFFLTIYSILVLAFAVPIHALLYPAAPIKDTWDFLRLYLDVAYDKMWTLFLTTLDSTKVISEGTCQATNAYYSSYHASTDISSAISAGSNCSQRNIIAIILYIIFLVLGNLLLVKTLIAFFAGTVGDTHSKAERLWRFSIYRFVYDYYYKPVLPGPLMIFELGYRFVSYIHQSRKRDIPPNTDFKEFYLSEEKKLADAAEFEYRKLEMFERSAVETVLAETYKSSKKGRDVVISKLHNATKLLHSRITDVEEELIDLKTVLEDLATSRSASKQ